MGASCMGTHMCTHLVGERWDETLPASFSRENFLVSFPRVKVMIYLPVRGKVWGGGRDSWFSLWISLSPVFSTSPSHLWSTVTDVLKSRVCLIVSWNESLDSEVTVGKLSDWIGEKGDTKWSSSSLCILSPSLLFAVLSEPYSSEASVSGSRVFPESSANLLLLAICFLRYFVFF
jgi:hypothetical protein